MPKRQTGRQRHRAHASCIIPDRETLEQGRNVDGSPFYDQVELEKMDVVRPIIEHIADVNKRRLAGRMFLRELWDSEEMWIQKTHFITVKDWQDTKASGPVVQLRWNFMQQRLHAVIQEQRKARLPIRINVLKGRQMGSSTFIGSWLSEQADINPQYYAMVLSYDDGGTDYLFEKAKFLFTRMWFPHDVDRHAGKIVQFTQPHGSALTCQTAGSEHAGSGRTIHGLHLSEMAKWANPEPVLLAVGQTQADTPGTALFNESTAVGAAGLFYDMWRDSERGESDFYPFFAPWYWDPAYSHPFADKEQKRAFGRSLNAHEREIRDAHGLTLEQLRWRRWTIRNKCGNSVRKFDQEYPTTPSVAFLTTGSPVFDVARVQQLYDNTTDPYFIGEIAHAG